ncbi:MAG: hypothetical protein KY463_00790 [Actinobacteria bacterium]|nr:hypothetical protein [Actinomycetota bacterium]
MLTISIIFALLVLLWGRLGIAHGDSLSGSDVEDPGAAGVRRGRPRHRNDLAAGRSSASR